MELTDRQIKNLFIEYWTNIGGYSKEVARSCAKELTVEQMKYQLANVGYISICGGRAYSR